MGRTGIDDSEVAKEIINVPMTFATMMIAVVLMAAILMLMLRFQAETSAKLTAHSLAGALTAVSSAPQNAVYCLKMPGGTGKTVYITERTVDGKTAGSILVVSPQGSFRTDMPATGFPNVFFRVPEGEEYSLRMTKRTPSLMSALGESHEIEIELLTKKIQDANCESVIT